MLTEEALSIHRERTNRFDVAWDLHLLGMIDVKLGRFEDAATSFREAARMFTADDDLSGLAVIASDTSMLALGRGQRTSGLSRSRGHDAKRRDGTSTEPSHPTGARSRKDIQRPAGQRGARTAMDTEAGIAYELESESG